MIKLILLFLPLFSSCAKVNLPYVHPELKPYIANYSSYAKKHLGFDVLLIQNIYVVFVDRFEVKEQNGKCSVKTGVGKNIERRIEISRYWWNLMSEGQKASLILHEMGHCSLMRNHSEAGKGIMSPYTISISGKEDFYAEELFGNSIFLNPNSSYFFLDRAALVFVGMNSGRSTKGKIFEHNSYINKGCSSLTEEH